MILMEQNNTPNHNIVVGICFTKCFTISFNLSSRIFEKSFIFSRTPFYIVILTGFERNWGIPKIS